MSIVKFAGHVAKIECGPKGKLLVTIHGESSFKGTDVSFEIPRENATLYAPGAQVEITITPKVPQ